jgi:hypothetical protein
LNQRYPPKLLRWQTNEQNDFPGAEREALRFLKAARQSNRFVLEYNRVEAEEPLYFFGRNKDKEAKRVSEQEAGLPEPDRSIVYIPLTAKKGQ